MKVFLGLPASGVAAITVACNEVEGGFKKGASMV